MSALTVVETICSRLHAVNRLLPTPMALFLITATVSLTRREWTYSFYARFS